MGHRNHNMGAAAEHTVSALFLRQGFEVWWPSKTQSRADFVASKDGTFLKVQVKVARWDQSGDNEYLRVRLSKPSRGSRPYETGDFDLLAVVDEYDIWLVPFEEIGDRSTLCVRKRGPTVRPFTDYNPDKWKVT